MGNVLQKVVTDVLKQKTKEDLSKNITVKELVDMLKDIRAKFELFPIKEDSSEINPFVKYLLPPNNLLDDADGNQKNTFQFQQMVAETNRVVQVGSFWKVIKTCLDDSFKLLYNLLKDYSSKKKTGRKFISFILWMSRHGLDSVLPSKGDDASNSKFYAELSRQKGVKDFCTVIYFPISLDIEEKSEPSVRKTGEGMPRIQIKQKN